MPTSIPAHAGVIAALIEAAQPSSVLDVGVGFGLYGMITRQYADVVRGRYSRDTWKCTVDGVEGFAGYITPVHDHLYDHVFLGDASEVVPKLARQYDLALLIDVIEHFDEPRGERLIRDLLQKARTVVLATPLNMCHQDAVFGNELEIHRHEWSRKALSSFGEAAFVRVQTSLIAILGPDAARLKRAITTPQRRELLKAMFPPLYSAYRLVRYGRT